MVLRPVFSHSFNSLGVVFALLYQKVLFQTIAVNGGATRRT